MATHTLHLASEPFEAIKSGNKVIESRLFDKKRQKIQLDDEVVFISRETPDRTIRVKVIGLLRYKDFENLFSHNELAKFGGPSVEWLNDQIKEFYSAEDQAKNGVLGIEFGLVQFMASC